MDESEYRHLPPSGMLRIIEVLQKQNEELHGTVSIAFDLANQALGGWRKATISQQTEGRVPKATDDKPTIHQPGTLAWACKKMLEGGTGSYGLLGPPHFRIDDGMIMVLTGGDWKYAPVTLEMINATDWRVV